MSRVLVVDDEPQILALYRAVFEHESFEVLEAASVKDGLRLLEAQPPDAIILDVSMSDGGALEMLRLLKERGCSIPAVVVTGYLVESISAVARCLGAAGVITKTAGPRAVLREVRRVLAA